MQQHNYKTLGRRDARKALINAVLAENLTQVEHIVLERPDIVDARNAHGHTALSEAVPTKNLSLVKLLVHAGADPKQYNHGGSSLIDAAAYVGSVEIAEYLKDQGCVLTLHHAAALGYADAIEQELTKNKKALTSRNARGATLLHQVAHGNQLDVCQLLITHGSNVDSRDGHGHTPLCYAVERNSLDCAKLLIQAGANTSHPAGHHGGTVLHRAIAQRSVDVSLLLLRNGSNPNIQDFSGKSALHAAISCGKIEIVKAVLESPINLELRTRPTRLQKGNETTLEYAQRLKKKRILKTLQDYIESHEQHVH